MNLKCYICGNDAEYLVNGTGLCKDHKKESVEGKNKSYPLMERMGIFPRKD